MVRMAPKDFEYLLNMVFPIISWKNTSFRQAIPTSDKLAHKDTRPLGTPQAVLCVCSEYPGHPFLELFQKM